MKIITDTGSDILVSEAKAKGIDLVGITVTFNEQHTITENTDESLRLFYSLLRNAAQLPVSSQPSPELYLTLYEEAKKQQEDVLVITISSTLSGTYNCAQLAKTLCDYDRIYIVDSLQASASERLLVEYAVRLRDEGKSAKEIADILDEVRTRTFLSGVPANLIYLKKGGRLSSLAAGVGDVLGIKPILILKKGEIGVMSKVRGARAARTALTDIIKAAGPDPVMPMFFSYSDNEENGRDFMNEACSALGLTDIDFHEAGPAIGTHVGPDALIIGFIATKDSTLNQ